MTEQRRYTLTFTRDVYDSLLGALRIGESRVENAAFVVCGVSQSERETRLLAREVVEVPSEDVLYQDELTMRIAYRAALDSMNRAGRKGGTILFVHTHPAGATDFSRQDDQEEAVLAGVAGNYHPTLPFIGTAVISGPDMIRARVWTSERAPVEISRIRVVGRRLEFLFLEESSPDYDLFDRQVRAFGRDAQKVLSGLCVGVVGCGGTGSSVAEQLARLGVGRILLFDHQVVEASNVSRIHESVLGDVGSPKVEVIAKRVSAIHPSIEVRAIPRRIVELSAARELRDCDVVFGCTDDDLGRFILDRFSLDYLVPVFDMGAKIDSIKGAIRFVGCRVTRLQAGHACLSCRRALDQERMRKDAFPEEEYEQLVREGYALELDEPDPAVVPFTTVTAGLAISQFIDFLTGFRGPDADVDQVLLRFDTLDLVKSSRVGSPECVCGRPELHGVGDRPLFLDMVWPEG